MSYLSNKHKAICETGAQIDSLMREVRACLSKTRPIPVELEDELLQAMKEYGLAFFGKDSYTCSICKKEFNPDTTEYATYEQTGGTYCSAEGVAKLEPRKVVYCFGCYQKEIEVIPDSGVDSKIYSP